MYRRNPKEKKETKATKEPDAGQKQQSTLKVTDQYIALLIRVFVAAGLLDVSGKHVPQKPRTPSNKKMPLGAHIYVRREHHRHEPFSESNLAHGRSSPHGKQGLIFERCCQSPGLATPLVVCVVHSLTLPPPQLSALLL